MATITQEVTTASMSTFLKDKPSSIQSTPLKDIPDIVSRQRTFYNTGATRPISFRKEQLRKLFYLVNDNIDEFVDALRADLGKALQEALATELRLMLSDIINVVQSIDNWSKDEYVSVGTTFKLNKCRIRKESVGVVLVMGPWNYPVWCTLCPALYAMAAGNTIILKPSEHAPHTSAVFARVAPNYFPPEYFTVVTGGISVASTLLNEKFDHVVYTGGNYGARAVALAAAKTLTPYTLELGGKSPCVVDTNTSDSKLEMFANRVVWGKFTNAGQVCLAVDHVIVVGSPERSELFIAYTKKAAAAFSKGGYMSKIVNEAHLERLQSLLSRTKGQVVYGGDIDKESGKIGLTIVKDVEMGDSLMNDEIFGPLLPVLRVDTVDQAVHVVKQSEAPLALYIFSENRNFINTVLDKCPSGGVTINDTLMHGGVPNLPFGGVGASGTGFYRSKYGFLHFCHLRPVTETPTWNFFEKMISSRYPPYTPENMKKFENLVGDVTPPFSTTEGSADRPQGAAGWVYAAGLAVIGGLAAIVYRQKQAHK